MSSLQEILKRNVKKMVEAIDKNQKGNIHPLIMKEVEKYLIDVVLDETKNNYFIAAKVLGISRSTLYRKIEELGIANNKKSR
ncbi:MAG: helix-turn-helix domain-containing protein [bacterium]